MDPRHQKTREGVNKRYHTMGMKYKWHYQKGFVDFDRKYMGGIYAKILEHIYNHKDIKTKNGASFVEQVLGYGNMGDNSDPPRRATFPSVPLHNPHQWWFASPSHIHERK